MAGRWADRAARVIAALVREGQASGEFRSDADGDVAARLVVSGLLQQTVWQQYAKQVPGLTISQDRLANSAVELFLHGLRPLTPSRRLRLER